MDRDVERELPRAESEIDTSLLEWFLQLSVTERLRAATRNAATLERLRRASSANR